ncbi:M15 family metallopeptidase [Nocardioides speluncae]|uniref:M15 family metallopeptidase n=1 Tax=Nocardioides speluncae TaxID=2670337 RepID=UPI000D68D494|nr:M15 family metallopeptidase [Nocardioides speluncae]
MILLSDEAVAALPVADCGEPMVSLRDEAGLRYDASPVAGPTGSMVRAGVRDRLVLAQSALPAGLHLLVVEGHRSVTDQGTAFEGYRARLAREQPHLTADDTFREASKYVAPVAVAPHCAGGAVDLTLCHDDGTRLDLGTEIDATPVDSDNACFTAATNVSPEATENRAVMGKALRAGGLVNYPTEWWHWSYGDRYWAISTGATTSIYGPITP